MGGLWLLSYPHPIVALSFFYPTSTFTVQILFPHRDPHSFWASFLGREHAPLPQISEHLRRRSILPHGNELLPIPSPSAFVRSPPLSPWHRVRPSLPAYPSSSSV